MIQFEEPGISVEHRRQFEYRVADGQRIHVDEQHFVVLEFEVLCMIVSVYHVVVVRHGLHHGEKFLSLLFRQIVLHERCPSDDGLLHVWQFALRHQSRVDQFEHLDVLLHAPVEPVRLFSDDLRERLFYHIIRDGSRYAEYEGQPSHFAFVLDVVQSVRIVEHLDYVVLVDPVDGAVGSASYFFAARDIHTAVCLLDTHHLGEARHLEHLVYFG